MLITSNRLKIRGVTKHDAEFIVDLFNSEPFLKSIGNRGIENVEQAMDKIENLYMVNYPTHGLFTVELAATGQAIGTVSFLKRDYLDYDDIGYGFLPDFWGKGYATEATKALLEHKLQSGVKCIYGLVDKDNFSSIKLLQKLNFQIVGDVVVPGENRAIYKMEYRVK